MVEWKRHTELPALTFKLQLCNTCTRSINFVFYVGHSTIKDVNTRGNEILKNTYYSTSLLELNTLTVAMKSNKHCFSPVTMIKPL